MPFGVLLAIPIGSAWLLADVGTEDRLPVSYFKSFFSYQIRKLKGDGIFRGRLVQKENKYQFANYITLDIAEGEMQKEEMDLLNNTLQKKERAERYYNRMKKKKEVFKKQQKEKEKR